MIQYICDACREGTRPAHSYKLNGLHYFVAIKLLPREEFELCDRCLNRLIDILDQFFRGDKVVEK